MSDTTTIREQNGLILEMSRRFKAPRDRVFDAWSTLAAMKHWFGPGDCELLGGEVDFRVGGHYRLELQTESLGLIEVGGAYHEIDRPETIAFSWKWAGHEALSKEEMQVLIEFAPAGENETEMRLTQTGFPDRESADNHSEGWCGSFEKLGPWVELAPR